MQDLGHPLACRAPQVSLGGGCESDHLQHPLRFIWEEGEEGVMTPRVRSLQEEGRWPPLPTVPSPPTSLFPWVWDPLTGTHPSRLWKGLGGGPHSLEQRNQTSRSACTSV